MMDIENMLNTFFFKDQRIKRDIIPGEVLFILKKLKDSGFLSFLVGGCVRDILLKRNVRDWDILTDARIDQIIIVFGEYKVLRIGKKYQTVTLILNYRAFQISSFRNNVNQQNNTHQEELFQRLRNDLTCRDFTINSIVWAEDKGIFDPTNGLQDLEQKLIQSINPDLRFKEDPLRILRAVRIACELGFSISEVIQKSICKHTVLIYHVSKERIRNEISLILECPDAKRGMLLLQQFGLERYIFSLDKVKKFQGTKNSKKNVFFSGIDKLKGNLAAQLALWGRSYFGSCQSACAYYFPVIECLRYDSKVTEKVKALLSREWEDIDFSSRVKIRFILANFGIEITELMMSLKKIQYGNNKLQKKRLKIEEKELKDEIEEKTPTKIADLALSGNDLIKMGIPEGKIIGEILNTIFRKVLISPEINRKDVLINLVQEIELKDS